MKIRPAVKEDAANIAEVQVRSWQESYKGIVDSDYLLNMSIPERIKRWEDWLSKGPSYLVYVLENEQSNICGFISGGAIRSKHPYDSEIYAFYLIKEIQQRGYGTKLFKCFSQQLVNEGNNSMIVWVLKENPSKRAYITLYGKKIDEELITIGKQELYEECYAWGDLSSI
ncbi:GNAT family N-acetyltransferase [Fictibacillus nanhaiensis]|uniref:GNAT family N-acetyltransferase n=1 Tax=Fictibacillus nanhaiensis TaxID=742169 RepID=UPI00203BFF10|nr:GNAT family N-acetyltransferase [Fictibacillus nanhaiensis]MCM3731376.1 GNAT family N-acetyltransferase [Fictibacillus nanhaiensis]